ncbi:MAG: hypothetical protein CMJ89_17450 [Planctomycetes bacterium]|nr:hypothetical protein [Planctomycetota bacterium]
MEFLSAFLFATASFAQEAGSGWQERPGERLVPDRILVEGSQRLEIRGGGLLCTRDGVGKELGVTSGGQPGRVFDLAQDPAGLSLIAAENGVFVLSRLVDALDPLEPMDGFDMGRVNSVFVDGRRRLWWAGEGVFGVLDMSGLWGRRFRPQDLPESLRAQRTLHVGRARDGGVLVVASKTDSSVRQTWRYRPDLGERPRVLGVSVDGVSWDPEHPIEVTYPEGFRLRASGTALGTASFRFRIDEHHVWRDLELTEEIAGFTPGEHTLDVIAVDRDLNRSEPLRLKVHSAYPARFDQRFVVVALALFAALGLGGFLGREWRLGWRPAWWLRAPLSTALLVVLTAQVLAAIEPHGKGWPFMGYSMYTTRFDRGDAIFQVVLIGLHQNGGERVIPPQAIGVAIDSLWQVLGPIVDGGEEVAQEYLDTYNELHPEQSLVGLTVRARRHRLTPRGAIEVAPQILSHYRVPTGAEGRGER